MNRYLLIAFAALLCTLGAQERPADAKPPRDPMERLQDNLGVDEKQAEQMQTIIRDSQRRKKTLRLDMESKEIELKKIFLEHDFDLGKLQKNTEERGAIWIKIQMVEFEQDAEIQKILSKEQFEKYLEFKARVDKLREARMEGRHDEHRPPPPRR